MGIKKRSNPNFFASKVILYLCGIVLIVSVNNLLYFYFDGWAVLCSFFSGYAVALLIVYVHDIMSKKYADS